MRLNLHPLSGGSFSNFVHLLKAYGCDASHLSRLLPAAAISGLGSLERAIEKPRLERVLADVEFQAEPIFILGHWRSGTTYLHHLMSQDPRFGYTSAYQAWLPDLFLRDSLICRSMVLASLPKTRPMDNVELSIQKPEEEELAMASACRYSYIHTFFFPKRTREIFRKSVLFEGLSEDEYQHWKDSYLKVLRMAHVASGNRQLLLKSPANTARISTLLEMFPNAKFIHIYRDPQTVFTSKLHTCQKLIDLWGFQSIDSKEIVDNVFYIYREVMNRYVEEHTMIPKGNLIEISYESLEKNPITQLSNIYRHLDIPGFSDIRHGLESYLSSNRKYKKNAYVIEPDMAARIQQEWSFALERWKYESQSSIVAKAN